MTVYVLSENSGREGYEPPLAVALNENDLKEWAWKRNLELTAEWSKPDTEKDKLFFISNFFLTFDINKFEIL